MNSSDNKYQKLVDNTAQELSLKTINKLLSMPDCGNIENHDNIQLGYSKQNRKHDILHIQILAERILFPFPRIYSKYLFRRVCNPSPAYTLP